MERQILFILGARACVPSDPLLAAHELGCRSLVFTPRPPTCGTDVSLIGRIERIHLHRPEEVVELARKLHAEQPLSGVVAYEEDAMVLAARVAQGLGLPAHPVDAAEAAMDKPTMKQRFAAAGVATADHVVAADEDDAVRWANAHGYPVVVKPCRGRGSQGVIRADDEDELRVAYRRLRRIVRDYGLDNGGRPGAVQLVESYLHGSEISVELLLQRGRPPQVTAVFEKPRPLTGPFFEETIYMTPARLDPQLQQHAEDLAMRAAAALGLEHGVAHCEIRLTDDGPYVLEVAARLLGGVCARAFRDRLGDDIHSLVLRLAMGEDIELPPPVPDAPIAAAMMLPVPAEGRLVAIHGIERARRVPGIRDVVVVGCPGEVIVRFPEQACYPIGFLSAAGSHHEAVEDALAWAAASISVELAPLECDRWERCLTEHDAAYTPPVGTTVTRLAELPTRTRRRVAVSRLVDVMFDELPRDEAVHACGRTVAWEEANRGEPAWLIVDGKALSLGSIDGDTGHLCCGGVPPGSRRRRLGSTLIRTQLAEFARRGCSRVVAETDPHLRLTPTLLEQAGFTRQKPDPTGPARVFSCALELVGQELAPEEARNAVGAQTCCRC